MWDDGASAVFLVQIEYESEGRSGSEHGRLVIDDMEFLSPLTNEDGIFHGREILIEPVDEDDMNGSVYFLSTHTPIHVKKIRVSESDDPKFVNVKMSFRLLYDQSGLGDDEDAEISAELELETEQ